MIHPLRGHPICTYVTYNFIVFSSQVWEDILADHDFSDTARTNSSLKSVMKREKHLFLIQGTGRAAVVRQQGVQQSLGLEAAGEDAHPCLSLPVGTTGTSQAERAPWCWAGGCWLGEGCGGGAGHRTLREGGEAVGTTHLWGHRCSLLEGRTGQ